jgi:hypothetical protein
LSIDNGPADCGVLDEKIAGIRNLRRDWSVGWKLLRRAGSDLLEQRMDLLELVSQRLGVLQLGVKLQLNLRRPANLQINLRANLTELVIDDSENVGALQLYRCWSARSCRSARTFESACAAPTSFSVSFTQNA